jgi:hypothetical protein
MLTPWYIARAKVFLEYFLLHIMMVARACTGDTQSGGERCVCTWSIIHRILQKFAEECRCQRYLQVCYEPQPHSELIVRPVLTHDITDLTQKLLTKDVEPLVVKI